MHRDTKNIVIRYFGISDVENLYSIAREREIYHFFYMILAALGGSRSCAKICRCCNKHKLKWNGGVSLEKIRKKIKPIIVLTSMVSFLVWETSNYLSKTYLEDKLIWQLLVPLISLIIGSLLSYSIFSFVFDLFFKKYNTSNKNIPINYYIGGEWALFYLSRQNELRLIIHNFKQDVFDINMDSVYYSEKNNDFNNIGHGKSVNIDIKPQHDSILKIFMMYLDWDSTKDRHEPTYGCLTGTLYPADASEKPIKMSGLFFESIVEPDFKFVSFRLDDTISKYSEKIKIGACYSQYKDAALKELSNQPIPI